MCLAVPGKLVKILPGGRALADLGGIEKAVNVSLIEGPAPGDWVIIHVGFALQKIDEAQARQTLALLETAAQTTGGGGGGGGEGGATAAVSTTQEAAR